MRHLEMRTRMMPRIQLPEMRVTEIEPTPRRMFIRTWRKELRVLRDLRMIE